MTSFIVRDAANKEVVYFDFAVSCSLRKTMRTVMMAAYHNERGGPVADFMNADVKSVDANMGIVDLAGLFLESGFRRYPVLKDNRLVGQISRRDVLRALVEMS